MVAKRPHIQEMGFSLIEVLIVIGIVAILMSLFSVVFKTLSRSYVDTLGQSDVSTYRTELKRKLRSFEDSPSGIRNHSQCLKLFGPGGLKEIYSTQLQGILSQMVKDTSSANTSIAQQKAYQIEIPSSNLLSSSASNNEKFGDYFAAHTFLNSFVLFSEYPGLRIQKPEIIDLIKKTKPASTFLTYLVQAELHVELSKTSSSVDADDRVAIKPIRLNFAIQKNQDGTVRMLDCGSKYLAEVVSQFEICKALGPDFRYVYDNFDGNSTGQCYAPIYDPTEQVPAFSDADYERGRVAAVTGYMPLKAFFCRFAMVGKGFDFSFCTGVN